VRAIRGGVAFHIRDLQYLAHVAAPQFAEQEVFGAFASVSVVAVPESTRQYPFHSDEEEPSILMVLFPYGNRCPSGTVMTPFDAAKTGYFGWFVKP